VVTGAVVVVEAFNTVVGVAELSGGSAVVIMNTVPAFVGKADV
jgi:hypothetical protein